MQNWTLGEQIWSDWQGKGRCHRQLQQVCEPWTSGPMGGGAIRRTSASLALSWELPWAADECGERHSPLGHFRWTASVSLAPGFFPLEQNLASWSKSWHHPQNLAHICKESQEANSHPQHCTLVAWGTVRGGEASANLCFGGAPTVAAPVLEVWWGIWSPSDSVESPEAIIENGII